MVHVPLVTKLFVFADASKILGRAFSFHCERGSHENLLVGTILGFEVSDSFELFLTVSNREFGGLELRGLAYTDGVWFAVVDKRYPEYTYAFPGTLELV